MERRDRKVWLFDVSTTAQVRWVGEIPGGLNLRGKMEKKNTTKKLKNQQEVNNDCTWKFVGNLRAHEDRMDLLGNLSGRPTRNIFALLRLRLRERSTSLSRSSHRPRSFSLRPLLCPVTSASPSTASSVASPPPALKSSFFVRRPYFIRLRRLLLLLLLLLFSAVLILFRGSSVSAPARYQRARELCDRESRNACARPIPSCPIQSHGLPRSTYCQPPM